jgi:hypothetical protein
MVIGLNGGDTFAYLELIDGILLVALQQLFFADDTHIAIVLHNREVGHMVVVHQLQSMEYLIVFMQVRDGVRYEVAC